MSVTRRKPPPPIEMPAPPPAASRGVSAGGSRSASRRVASVVLAVSLLSSCATSNSPTYREPPVTAPTAKVRVVNTRPYAYYAAIAIFDAASCFDKATIGMTGGGSKDEVRIGMLDDKPPSAASVERHVRADEPLVIGPRAVFPTATVTDILHALTPELQEQTRTRQAGVCRMPTFVPKTNEQYEVLVDLTPAHCSVTPYRLVDAGGTVKREEVESQLTPISTYEFDMKCFK